MGKLIGLTMGVVMALVVFVAVQATIDANDGRIQTAVTQLVRGGAR